MESLFSLLLVLLLPPPSMFYSLKNCTADFYNQGIIDCSRNHLSTIPSDIPKDATEIYLDFNIIETIRQADLRGYTDLQWLSFHSSHLSLIEDGAFLNLSSLTELILSSNALQNLTDNMFTGLSNLMSLNLRENPIQHISKFAFGPLKSLKYVDMESTTELSSDIVHVISHTPNIRALVFEGSSFEADHWPFPLQKLTTLSFQSGFYKRFSVHTDVLPYLKHLVLDKVFTALPSSKESEFEWDVPKNHFKHLKSLELSVSKLTTENYLSILQSVDSVEILKFGAFGNLFNQSVLDAACSIPALKSLKIFSRNITFINDVFLRSCSRLTKLVFFSNTLHEFAESSLRTMTRLKQLNVESNLLSSVPAGVRNLSTLIYLSFERNHIRKLQCSDFSNLPRLRLLNLNYNRIRQLKTCVLKDLKNLNVLFIENNILSTLDDTFGSSFPKLVVFSAKENYLNPILKSTFNKALTLRHLNIQSKSATDIENGAFEGNLNLNQLTFSQNYQSGGVFSGLDHLQSLVVFITSNKETVVSKPLTFNISSLRKMTIAVDRNVCVDQAFYHLHNMTHLQSFSLDTVCCVTPTDTFSETPNLKNLKITNCAGFRPESELFQPISQLQFLDLSHNRINNLTFLSKANLTKLEKLILSNNALRIIDGTLFKALPSLKYLDLAGNPFACDCANAGFIMWATKNKQVQVANSFLYKCSTPSSLDGHLFLDFKIQICWKDIGFLYFLSSSALVVSTLLSSFLYHFMRWQLVYGFYLLRACLYNVKKRKQRCAHVYDAFVSYNVHDEDWVYGELVPELEQRQRWKLCLHHRDFEPGKPIIENITDAIHSSRKTLCVISRHYLQSEWCSQEIQMASFRLFDEKKDVLILLFLEELSSNQLAPFYRIRKLVRSRTYLSWDQARGHKALFWEKVQRALEIGDNLEENL